ncbi:MAG: ACT domain-containing protein [Candidatus Lokiarchaeota archaeon]|nr:ACT domain-containing protein [Candidatus Lokiarchaeota archaeon]MBD3199166.1 ACT domain-containing protein [Candidatus Lokiarchaeota archaeon]
MKEVRIISIDSRGRIVIPQIIRKSLGITEHSQLMLIADSESKEIKITPTGIDMSKQPIKLRITMEDLPGALAKIASTFGSLGISLMYGESVIVEKEKTAIWTVISPTPEIPLENLKNKLLDEGGAKKVEIISFE